ncbi:TetR/AcrR family transcriptional regulator [Streptomyces sp. NPDC020681]|uniref:TetR/AcrR family transcriptional regulator n=1 Tax=Streptomyces sp. NPDC020681 TaxID=3365083 RepID=UPI0037AA8A63
MSEDERVKRIMDAAYACFTRHGVRRTTMDDIAREAGMSRPAVYQYVRNKEDAFRRMAARLLDATLADAHLAAKSGAGLTGQLTAILQAKLDLALRVWRDSPAHAAELLGEDARLSAEHIDTYNAAMRDLLVKAVATADTAMSRNEAAEFADILLAFTRGLEADLSDPDAPTRRLGRGVALLVAGLHPKSDHQESS